MHTRTRALVGLFALSAEIFMISWPADARSFPDVPAAHAFMQEIDELSNREIIKGNPDGSFKPASTVNRAELVTMLYRATGKTAPAPSSSCFNDVPKDAWFSAVICDAVENGYVGGYGDGTFRPGNPVNRVEALKMVQTVFEMRINTSASLSPLSGYGDIAFSAWYVPYMANAFARGVLPIAGQTGNAFNPEKALTRGEAAAYIFNALGLVRKNSSEASSSSSFSASSKKTSSSSASISDAISVDFPFGDDGSVKKGQTHSYTFSLASSIVARFHVEANAGSMVDCRLYKLEGESSFAFEYYLGQRSGHNCSMTVALSSGNYQFELSTRGSDIQFTVETQAVKGDGNDGFREAKTLSLGSAKTGFIQTDDYGEWYKFTVSQEAQMKLSLSNEEKLSCLMYPMADVNLFGFSGPVCNETYLFPTGTYYVSIVRRDGVNDKQSFTVELR